MDLMLSTGWCPQAQAQVVGPTMALSHYHKDARDICNQGQLAPSQALSWFSPEALSKQSVWI